MSLQKQELFNLVRNSKLAQVATPLLTNMRAGGPVPTHQIIFTPKSSAVRSNFGIKTSLPKQIGTSHIIFNDIDNRQNMPDVEKFSGSLYSRLKFQETGLPLKSANSDKNPLFSTKINSSSVKTNDDTITSCLNVHSKSSSYVIKKILSKNPQLYKEFQSWLVQNHPEAISESIPKTTLDQYLKEFLNSSPSVKKQDFTLNNLSKKKDSIHNNVGSLIQGTAGLSYAQKGRLSNTPNGVKYGYIAPGRIIGHREAAIAGFSALMNEKTVILQNNYAKNAGGRHPRQFVMPFKINEAELTEKGSLRMTVDGVRAGTWMQRSAQSNQGERSRYDASNPNFGAASERNKAENENLQRLLNLIIQ